MGKLIQATPLALYFLEKWWSFQDERLRQDLPLFSPVNKITFENPVGLAAGFDKNAELIPLMQALGFGFTEIGSVTAKGGVGNTPPRLLRLLQDQALINRLGLKNDGAELVFDHLAKLQLSSHKNFPIGVNIAKTHNPCIMGDAAIKDFLTTYQRLRRFASYITLNISCPNTLEGKTFEDPLVLQTLLQELFQIDHYNVPVLVKLSPDLSSKQLKSIVETSSRYGVNGYVIGNTTTSREGLQTDPDVWEKFGRGGLSGPLLYHRVREMVGRVYELTEGKVPIIGVGGINSAESAYGMIKSGASLVQIFTGLIYHGPGLVKGINKSLVQLLERDGLHNISEAVGAERR